MSAPADGVAHAQGDRSGHAALDDNHTFDKRLVGNAERAQVIQAPIGDRAKLSRVLGNDRGLEAVLGEPPLGLLRAGEARLHQQHAPARSQVRRRAIADAVDEHAPVGSRVPRTGRATRRVAARRGDVRRVGDDEVEAPPPHRLEQVTTQHLEREAVEASVQPRTSDRPPADVDRCRMSAQPRRGQSEDAGPRAEVEHRSTREVTHMTGQHAAEQRAVAGRPQNPGEDDDAHARRRSLARTPPIAAVVVVEQVVGARVAYRALHSDSLDSPPRADTDDDGDSLLDTMGGTDANLERVLERSNLDALINTLEDRERLIVRLYYQGELTQSEIGVRLGLSQMHISRLLRSAVKQLTEYRDQPAAVGVVRELAA